MDEAQHISHRYDKELKAVHNRVLVMGELIEQQMDTALEVQGAGFAADLTAKNQ